ncbi:hypothetical protein L486_03364 [Kwoniella mangroviensis CBS 10435]|uniref:Fe2OG dioxygenase domain-containing protein n=1 Tax=Kwoniella mangroviensis CBS 10435 TaxID=1331196 RepID=A0A1B9ITM3_9TREE|nr:hypothetical protein L486_03364 [Kwoniella mangroviensis CBS 10435]
MSHTGSSSPNSLFSEYEVKTAKRLPPDIPGLWVFPSYLPDDIARNALTRIASADLFSGGERDQVMLFEAPKSLSAKSSLPTYIHDLLRSVNTLLETRLPANTTRLLFDQPLARQVILNLYPPGQGISPHIDLPNRYADGILGCSLTGGCVMTLSKDGEEHRVYMPPRTVYVLSEEARWEWYHGIDGCFEDIVEVEDEVGQGTETILRDLRVSVTFRWMKEGADILS